MYKSAARAERVFEEQHCSTFFFRPFFLIEENTSNSLTLANFEDFF